MIDLLDRFTEAPVTIKRTPQSVARVPAAVVSVQRRSGGNYINVAGGVVQPYEPIQFLATDFGATGKAVVFTLRDSSGNVQDAREIVRNPWDSQVSYELTAPGTLGVYTVTAHEIRNLFLIPLPSPPDSTATFEVSDEAPPPPSPKPDTSFLGGVKDVFKWGVIAAVAIGAVVLVKEAAPATRAVKEALKR